MIDKENNAMIGINDVTQINFNPAMANRHGLITGATGTGKTISLQVLAETFSQMGTPVFAADAKGDLSGVALPGGNKTSVTKRVEKYSLDAKGFFYQEYPVQFWDILKEQGIATRASISSMGPLLLSRLLSLNDTQTALLTVAFTIAENEGLQLVSFKDIKKLLEHISANAEKYSGSYGTFASTSVGAILRSIVALEHNKGGSFFGTPSLSILDFIETKEGKGVINILASDKLMQSPSSYTTFLLWLMNELFSELPEVGDLEKPKLVFFFDEAHLLFSNISKPLLEKVEQVVRLVRSKGVGIYFITQNPSDIPDTILSQLGNRIQHALRAYTPKDRTALKAAAMSFRTNPLFDTETAISELETGEALVSFLDSKGAPQPVERVFIIPPQSFIGPISDEKRKFLISSSPLWKKYEQEESTTTAYDILNNQEKNTVSDKEIATQKKEDEKKQKELEKERKIQEKQEEKEAASTKKFWTSIIKSIIVPILRKFLQTFINKR